MSSIDERIVEMKFENHLFNKNVESSVGVLEKLKETLKFDGIDKNLSNINDTVNKIDFSKITSDVGSLAKSLSTTGTIWRTIIQDMTRSAEALIAKIASFGPGGLIGKAFGQMKSGGWSRATNIDQAKFQIEGLGRAWEEVSGSIDYAVTGTAYGADAAAKAASQLLASGVAVGDGMNHALRGISGVAAMTNSTYEEISPIFTTIAGQGKVMTMQLRQLESRGLNVAASLGKSTGKFAGKTEKEIRDLVTAGKIEFQDFADAMDEVFGEHATEADKTFEGSLANMKAALSRIGQKVMQPFRKNMVDIFRTTKGIINDINNTLTKSGVFDHISTAMNNVRHLVITILNIVKENLGFFEKIGDGIKYVVDIVGNGAKQLSESIQGYKGAFGLVNYELNKLTEGFQIVDKLIPGFASAATNAVNGVVSASSNAYKEYQDILAEFEELGVDKSQTVFGNINLNARQVLEWTEETVAIYEEALKSWGELDPKALIGEVSTVFAGSGEYNGIEVAFTPMIQTTDGSERPILLSQAAVDKYIYALFDKAGEGWNTDIIMGLDAEGMDIDGVHVSNIIGDIGEKASITAKAMHFLGKDGAISQAFKRISEASKNVTSSLEDVDKVIERIWAGDFGNGEERFAAIDALYGVEGAGHAVQNRLNELANCDFRYADACELSALTTQKESDAIQNASAQIDSFGDTKNNFISTIAEIGSAISGAFSNAMPKVVNWLATALLGLRSAFSILAKTAGSIAKGAIGGLINIFGTIGSVLGKVTSIIFDGITGFALWAQNAGVFEGIEKVFSGIFNAISNVFSVIGDFVKLGFQGIGTAFGKIGEAIAGSVDKIKEFWGALKETQGFKNVTAAFSGIMSMFESVKNSVFERISGFFETLSNTKINLPEFDLSSAAEKASDAISWVADKVEALKGVLSSFGGTVHEWLFGSDVEMNGWQMHIPGFLDSVSDKIQAVKAVVKSFGGKVYEFLFGKDVELNGWEGHIPGFLEKVWEKIKIIKDALVNFGGNVKDFVVKLFGIDEAAGSASSKQNKLNKVMNTFAAIGKKIGSWVVKAFTAIKDGVIAAKDNVVAFWTAFKQTEAYNTMLSMIEKLKTKLIELKDRVLGKITNVFSDFEKKGLSLPKIDMGALAGKVSDGIMTIIEKINAAREAVSKFFTEKFGGEDGAFAKLKEFFTDFDLKEAIETLTGLLSDAVQAIRDFFASFFGEEVPTQTITTEVKQTNEQLDELPKIAEHPESLLQLAGSFTQVKGAYTDLYAQMTQNNPEDIGDYITNAFIAYKNTDSIGNLITALTGAKQVSENVFGVAQSAEKTVKKTETVSDKFVNDVVPAVSEGVETLGEAIDTEYIETNLSKLLGSIKDFVTDKPVAALTGAFAGFLSFKATKGVANIFGFFGNLGKAVKDFGKSSKIMAKAYRRDLNAKALRNVAIALGILTASFWALGQLNWDQFKMAAAGITVLTLALSFLMFVASKTIMKGEGGGGGLNPLQSISSAISDFGQSLKKGMEKFGIAAIIASFVIGIKVLVDAIVSLLSIPADRLVVAGVVIGILVTVLGLAMKGIFKNGKGVKWSQAAGILAFCFGMKMIAEALAELGEVDNLWGAVGAVTVMAVILRLFIGSIGKIASKKKFNAKNVFAIIGVIAVLSLAIAGLASLGAEDASLAASALSGVFIAARFLIKSMAKLEKTDSGATKEGNQRLLIRIAGIVVILGGILGMLLLLQSYPTEQLATVGTALLKVIWAVSRLATAVSKMADSAVNMTSPTDLLYLLGEGGVIFAIIAGIIAIAGALGQIQDGEENSIVANFIKDGIPILNSLADAIGEFIGHLAGALVKGFVDVFNDGVSFVEKLTGFITDLGPAMESAKSISADDLGGVIGIFIALAAAEIVGAIENVISFFTGKSNVETAKQTLIDFADTAVAYSNALTEGGGVNSEAIQASKDACDIMIALANKSPKTGGFLQKILGESEPGKWAEKLVPFAKGMAVASAVLALVDSAGVKAAEDACSIILSLANATPNTGGFLQDLLGESEPGKYGDKLVPFAEGMVKYSQVIKDLEVDEVNRTDAAANMIIALSKQVPETGGILQMVMGETDPEVFGKKLEPFAQGMVDYSKKIKELDISAVEKTNGASTMIMDLSNAIPDLVNGGLLSFFDDNDMDTFSDSLPKMAEAFVKFSQGLEGFDRESALDASYTMKNMADFVGNIKDINDGIGSNDALSSAWNSLVASMNAVLGNLFNSEEFREAKENLVAFGKELGQGIFDGVAQCADEDPELGNHSAFQKLVDNLFAGLDGDTDSLGIESRVKPLTNKIKECLVTGIENMEIKAKSALGGVVSTSVQAVKEDTLIPFKDWIYSYVRLVIDHVVEIINEKTPDLASAVRTINNSLLNLPVQYYSKWNNVGRNIDLHWAAGLRNNKNLVLDAVKDITNEAIDVVNHMAETIDHTVSEATEEVAENTGGTFTGQQESFRSMFSTLGTFNSKVDDTMSNITSALAAAYLYINQVIQQAMDSTPTITPVLDLSQLQNGMGYMNSMIGQNQFLNSNLHYAMTAFPGSYSYGNTQMSYDNSSMIDALNGVREDIKTLGEEMSNMKMVLDSGALVGSIGTGVDQKLGNIQKFKERWA